MIVHNKPKPKPQIVPSDVSAPIYGSFEEDDFSKEKDDLTYLEKLCLDKEPKKKKRKKK